MDDAIIGLFAFIGMIATIIWLSDWWKETRANKEKQAEKEELYRQVEESPAIQAMKARGQIDLAKCYILGGEPSFEVFVEISEVSEEDCRAIWLQAERELAGTYEVEVRAADIFYRDEDDPKILNCHGFWSEPETVELIRRVDVSDCRIRSFADVDSGSNDFGLRDPADQKEKVCGCDFAGFFEAVAIFGETIKGKIPILAAYIDEEDLKELMIAMECDEDDEKYFKIPMAEREAGEVRATSDRLEVEGTDTSTKSTASIHTKASTIRDSRRVESPPQGIFLGELQDYLEPFWHDSELAMQVFDLLGKTLDKMGYSLMSGKATEGKAHELWAGKKHVDKTS
jgi:hypothetical protein